MLKIKPLGIAILVCFVLSALLIQAVYAESIINQIYPDTINNQIVIQSIGNIEPKVSKYTTRNPRLIIDLYDSSLDMSLKNNYNLAKSIENNFDAVSKIIFNEFNSGSNDLRIVIHSSINNLDAIKVKNDGNNQVIISLPENIQAYTYSNNYNSKVFTEDKSSIKANKKEKITDYQSNYVKDSLLTELKNQIYEKERQIDQLISENSFLKQTVPSQLTNPNFVRTMETLKQENASLKDKNDSIKQENDSIKSDLSATKAKLAVAAQKLTASGNLAYELEKVKEQRSLLKAKLNKAVESIQSISSQRNTINEIKSNFSQVKQENTNLKTQIFEANENLKTLKEKLTNLSSLNKSLQERNTEFSRKYSELNKSNTDLMTKYRDLSKSNSSLLDKYRDLNELSSQYAVRDRDLSSSNTELLTKYRNLNKANAELTSKNEELMALNVKLNESKIAHSNLNEKLLQLKQVQNQVIQSDIQNKRIIANLKLQLENEKAKNNNDKYKEHFLSANQTIARLKTQLDNALEKLNKLAKMKQDTNLLETRFNIANDQIMVLKNELSEANIAVTENKKQLNNALAKIEEYQNSMPTENYKNELISAKQNNSKLTELIKKLKTDQEKQLADKKQILALQKELNEAKMILDNYSKNDNKTDEIIAKYNELQISLDKERQKSDLLSKKNYLLIQKLELISDESSKESLKIALEENNNLKEKLNNALVKIEEYQTSMQSENYKNELISAQQNNIKLTELIKKMKTDIDKQLANKQQILALQKELNEANIILENYSKNDKKTDNIAAKYNELELSLEQERKKADLLSEKNNLLIQKLKMISNKSNNESLKTLLEENNILKEQLAVASSVIIDQSEALTKSQSKMKQRLNDSPVLSGQVKVSNEKTQRIYQEAVAARDSNDISRAIELLNILIKREPNYVRSYVLLGSINTEMGEFDVAMDNLKIALSLDPDNNAARHYLGNLYYAMGNFSKARDNYKLAISINDLSNFSSTLKNQGKVQDSIATYKAAIVLSPEDPDIYYNLAGAYKLAGNNNEAISNYNKALEINPNLLNAHYNIAITYAAIGNRNLAVNHLKRYLELNPNSNDAEKVRTIIAKLQ